jgi:hypothetical protein
VHAEDLDVVLWHLNSVAGLDGRAAAQTLFGVPVSGKPRSQSLLQMPVMPSLPKGLFGKDGIIGIGNSTYGITHVYNILTQAQVVAYWRLCTKDICVVVALESRSPNQQLGCI